MPAPNPPLSELAATAEAIRNQEAVLQGILVDLTVARAQMRNLNVLGKTALRREADHVQATCGDNAEKVLSTGFRLAAEPRRRGPLPTVENVPVQISDFTGQLDLRWPAVPGTLCYLAGYALSPDGPWTMTEPTTRAECTVSGLTPGTKYWLRVRAFGTAGTGPWSNATCRMAA